jgi:prepilin-type N-terminal cleavage/methylation domain-containing protein
MIRTTERIRKRVVRKPVVRSGNQRGETLIEVLIAVVLIGAISSAYFFGEATQTRVSVTNKELVTADGVARSYAELTKAAVRNGCTAANPNSPFTVNYTAPPGFSVTTPMNQQICPVSRRQPRTIDLTVTTPSNLTAQLSVEVRTP